MAVVTRGYTYSVNGQVTNTNLHTLVDGATVTDINRADAKSDTGFFTIQTTAPTSPKTGEAWFDTTSGIARIYNGTNWIIMGRAELLTNKSGAQSVAGDVVIVSTSADRSFTTTTTAQDPLVAGVVLATVANNAQGIVLMPGAYAAQIKVTTTTAAGNFLATSTTAAKAAPSATPTRGTFAIAMSADSGGFVSGILLYGTGSLSGTANVQAALDGADSPSATNVFATKKEFDPRQRQYFTDDFESITPFSTTSQTVIVVGQVNYRLATASSGTTGTSALSVFAGVARVVGQDNELSLGNATTAIYPFLATKTNFSFKTRFAPRTPGVGTEYVGLHDSTGVHTAATSYLRIKATGATGNYIAEMANGGAATTLDTGIARADGVYHDFELRRTASGVITVYVDGTSVGTLTATIPTALMTLAINSSASAVGIDIDYWQVDCDK